jgi:UDP-N-acetylmuramate dehydrogenase
MVIEAGNPANRSCGSFFVNPVVSHADVERVHAVAGPGCPHYVVDERRVKIPAAWLIERAGYARGYRRGPVGLSPYQAQAIVNYGGACAADVIALASDVKAAVWKTFGIAIVPEPIFVGFGASAAVRELLADRGSSECPRS